MSRSAWWRAGATTCSPSTTISRRCWPTWRRRFPPWRATGPDGLGPPRAPAWQARELAARGGRLEAITVEEPKARHGRREARMLWALADPELNAYVGSSGEHGVPWPHLAQICRAERRRETVRGGRVVKAEVDVRYLVTSAPPARAGAAELVRALRGHWGIENRIHWVRDATFDEDRCQVRSGAAPQAFAACRNLAIALVRRRDGVGAPIAAALRTHAARPRAAVALVLTGGGP